MILLGEIPGFNWLTSEKEGRDSDQSMNPIEDGTTRILRIASGIEGDKIEEWRRD